jgi:FlaG/FlaF family flagellin (archaellin)
MGSRGESRTLTLVVATVVVVIAVPVVLSFLLYIFVLGLGGTEQSTPQGTLTAFATANGYGFMLSAPTGDVAWTDVVVYLDSIMWSPDSSALDLGRQCRQDLPQAMLDGITVWCNVTDTAGNGFINQGDYFTLETGSTPSFVGSGTHIVRVVYRPTSLEICSTVFVA